MLRLILAFIVPLASAAPQYAHVPYGFQPQYPVYPVRHVVPYGLPVVQYKAVVPQVAVAVNSQEENSEEDAQKSRFIFDHLVGISSGGTVKGSLEKSTATNADIEGDITVEESPFYGTKISGILKNLDGGKKYIFGFGTSCTTMSNTATDIRIPDKNLGQGHLVLLFPGGYNVSGYNGKTSVKGKYLLIKDESGTIKGCTKSTLA